MPFYSIFLALCLTLASVFIVYQPALQQAYGQFGSGGFANTQPLQVVSGNYTNTDAGLQITLPANWTGSLFESRNGTVTTIRVVPNDLGQSTQGFRVADSMTIRIVPKNITSGTISSGGNASTTNSSAFMMFGQGRNFQNRGNLTCTRDTPQTTTINDMQGILQTAQCSSSTFSFMIKSYAFQTQDRIFTVSFMATSSAGFSKYVPAFDNSVNTLRIANTIQAPAVPEFPAAAIGIAFAGAVGLVSFAMRTRQLRGRSLF
jgi:hypothetical protein